MKMKIRIRSLIPVCMALAVHTASAQVQPVDYVDMFMGNRGESNCVIGPQLPHGSVNPSPQTPGGGNDGYDPLQPIRGFGQLHVSGTGWGRYGQILLSPQVGFSADEQGHDSPKSGESALPYYYAVTLDRYGIRTELAPTHNAAIYRFSFPAAEDANILLDIAHNIPQHIKPEIGGRFLGGAISYDPETGIIGGWGSYRGGFGSGAPLQSLFRRGAGPGAALGGRHRRRRRETVRQNRTSSVRCAGHSTAEDRSIAAQRVQRPQIPRRADSGPRFRKSKSRGARNVEQTPELDSDRHGIGNREENLLHGAVPQFSDGPRPHRRQPPYRFRHAAHGRPLLHMGHVADKISADDTPQRELRGAEHQLLHRTLRTHRGMSADLHEFAGMGSQTGRATTWTTSSWTHGSKASREWTGRGHTASSDSMRSTPGHTNTSDWDGNPKPDRR